MKNEKMFAGLSIIISIIILLIAFFTHQLGVLFIGLSVILFIFGVVTIISIFSKIKTDNTMLIGRLGIIMTLVGAGSINANDYSLLALLMALDGMCICGIHHQRLQRETENTAHKSFDYISNSSETYKKIFLEINRDKFSKEEKRLFLERYRDEFSEEEKQWFLETKKEEIGGKIDEENKNINNITPNS